LVEKKTIEEDIEKVSDNLAKANRNIKGGMVAGVFSGTVTLVFTLVEVIVEGFGVLGLDSTRWSIVDVMLHYGLAYGIHKKSRLCAIVLFTYFIVSRTWMYVESGNYRVFIIAFAFVIFLFKGIVGTFVYPRLIEKKKRICASGSDLP